MLSHGVDKLWTEFAAAAASVDDPPVWLPGRTGPARQHKLLIAAGFDVVQALERGRGRAKHDRHASRMGAHHSHVATVVPRTFGLFEAAVVLFINDDQA